MADRGIVTLSGWFARQTVVIDDGAVLELDGNFASDRIRRVTFDRIRSVTASSTINYGRVFMMVLMFGGAAFALIGAAASSSGPERRFETYGMVSFGLVLLLISLLLLFQAMIYRRCQIRIESNVGPPIKVAGSASRKVVNRFVALLAEQVRTYQASLR